MNDLSVCGFIDEIEKLAFPPRPHPQMMQPQPQMVPPQPQGMVPRPQMAPQPQPQMARPNPQMMGQRPPVSGYPPMRQRDPVSLGKSFIAGLDPTGAQTFKLSQRSTRHGLHRGIGLAGGIIGGATIVPAIGGMAMGAAKALKSKNPGKLMGVLKGMKSGAVIPFKQLHSAAHARKGLQQFAQTGQKLSPKQVQHIHNILGTKGIAGKMGTEAQALVDQLGAQATGLGADPNKVKAAAQKILGQLRGADKSQVEKLLNSMQTRQAAGGLAQLVKSKEANYRLALGLGSAIGGGSAYLQYGLGKKVGEKERSMRAEIARLKQEKAAGGK